MGDSMQALLSSRDYCLAELYRIRAVWETRVGFTDQRILAAKKTLLWMMMYAPQSVQTLVDATLMELERREVLCALYPPPKGGAA